MSANYIVDLGNVLLGGQTIQPGVASAPTSGVTIGLPIQLRNANSLTNVQVGGAANSGILVVQIQTGTGSGLFQSGGGLPASGFMTDPTSGYVDFPGPIKSGGLMYINSGLFTLMGGGGASGGMNINTFQQGEHSNYNNQLGGWLVTSGSSTVFGSGGGNAWGHFQRPQDHDWVRVNILGIGSGFTGLVYANVFGMMRTTGSGGGFTTQPQTGTVNV